MHALAEKSATLAQQLTVTWVALSMRTFANDRSASKGPCSSPTALANLSCAGSVRTEVYMLEETTGSRATKVHRHLFVGPRQMEQLAQELETAIQGLLARNSAVRGVRRR